ncbi:MAG: efflux RND transporter periplasmic adaptor subunit [Planctomycetota bacterium]|jgi:multidrug efflux pump subunit AcrA (membrane-fusion protein)
MKLALVRIGLAVVVVALGAVMAKVLIDLKSTAESAEPETPPVLVRAVRVSPRDVQVRLTGYGTARVPDVLVVVPEVSGRLVEVSSLLEAGRRVPRGTVLFAIDAKPFELALRRAETERGRLKHSLALLKLSRDKDKERLPLAKKAEDLAKRAFERTRDLFEKDVVGTVASVAAAEAGWVQRRDQRQALENALALYPTRILEAETGLQAAEIQIESARWNLQKTSVTAPFSARVLRAVAEVGAVVSPPMEIARLADDSRLEIPVPLDGAQCAKWFPFLKKSQDSGDRERIPWWFSRPDPAVEIPIRWVDAPDPGYWAGRLDRIERFDPQTRTAHIVVSVESPPRWKGAGPTPSPLVEGMFCKVEIPGRVAFGVFTVPSVSVDQDGTVFVAREGRLKKVRVTEVVRREQERTLVQGGLQAGDTVLTSRTLHLVEGTALQVVLESSEGEEARR